MVNRITGWESESSDAASLSSTNPSTPAGATAAELAGAIEAALADFTGGQPLADDRTLVVVKRSTSGVQDEGP